MAMIRNELDRVFDLVGFSTTDKDLIQIFLDFAGVIAEEEREACAVICENDEDYSNGDVNYHSTLIRARGK